MDFDDLKPQAQKLPIKSALGDETPIVFHVVGRDSHQYRAMLRKQARSFLADLNDEDTERLERNHAEQVACHIVGWEGYTKQGAPVPYSPEAALNLIMNPELGFVREQVEEFASKRANFFRPSDTPAV